MQEAGRRERSEDALKAPSPGQAQQETGRAAVGQPLIRSSPERFVFAAGRVVRHARRSAVVLSHLAAGLLTVCLEARAALARLATG